MNCFSRWLVLLAVAPMSLWAEDQGGATDGPEGCVVADQSDVIRIVLCDDMTLTADDMVAVGTWACGEALPCGAWMWTDDSLMPTAAPENHDGLTPEQIAASLGVWVAEQENLVQISKAEN